MVEPKLHKQETQDRKIRAAERQTHALELRKAGKDYKSIAETLGYQGEASAYNAVKAALLKAVREPALEVRRLEVERLDRIMLALWPKAIAGDTDAIDRVLKIMARRAAYLGLDAPKEMQLSGKDGEAITIKHSEQIQFWGELGRVLGPYPELKQSVEVLLRRQIAYKNGDQQTVNIDPANG